MRKFRAGRVRIAGLVNEWARIRRNEHFGNLGIGGELSANGLLDKFMVRGGAGGKLGPLKLDPHWFHFGDLVFGADALQLSDFFAFRLIVVQ